MEPQQQQDVCARCAQPLAEDEARFNKVYWGMAHRRCRADAVWPPIFRPSLNPNEVMRQIFALCAHLGKLAAIGLPIPQFLPSHQQTAPTPQPPPQPQRMDADGDAKDTGDVVPVQPTTNNQQPPTQQQPTPTPSKKKTETEQTHEKESPTAKPQVLPVINNNTMREYDLQQQVKAVGGRTLVQDSRSLYRQFRSTVHGKQVQFTEAPEHTSCRLSIYTWGERGVQDIRCLRCGKQSRRGELRPDSICDWHCNEHGIDVCFQCIPVVLRTPEGT